MSRCEPADDDQGSLPGLPTDNKKALQDRPGDGVSEGDGGEVRESHQHRLQRHPPGGLQGHQEESSPHSPET